MKNEDNTHIEIHPDCRPRLRFVKHSRQPIARPMMTALAENSGCALLEDADLGMRSRRIRLYSEPRLECCSLKFQRPQRLTRRQPFQAQLSRLWLGSGWPSHSIELWLWTLLIHVYAIDSYGRHHLEIDTSSPSAKMTQKVRAAPEVLRTVKSPNPAIE